MAYSRDRERVTAHDCAGAGCMPMIEGFYGPYPPLGGVDFGELTWRWHSDFSLSPDGFAVITRADRRIFAGASVLAIYGHRMSRPWVEVSTDPAGAPAVLRVTGASRRVVYRLTPLSSHGYLGEWPD